MDSKKALDGLNFTLADVRDGVGPYLALFLIGKAGWTPGRIGWALSAASLATLLVTSPAGYIFDRAHSKRLLMVSAVLAIGAAAGGLAFVTAFPMVLGLQIIMGLAAGFLAPGMANLTLGLVGPKAFAKRVGRNETFNHGGNFAASLLCGALAQSWSVVSVFGVVVVMSLISAVFTGAVRPCDIDLARARGLKPRHLSAPLALSQVFNNGALLLALVSVFGFQLANASLLPIAAQLVSQNSSAENGVRLLSVGIVIAQLTAIPVAWGAGHFAKNVSAFWILGLGLGGILVRALIFMMFHTVWVMSVAQIFDGLAAGVLAVAPVLLVFELTKGSGHFSFVTGVLASAISLGAAVSNALGGFLIEAFGPAVYFLVTCLVALLSMIALLVARFARRGQDHRARIASLYPSRAYQ